jgi:hypothetical protein
MVIGFIGCLRILVVKILIFTIFLKIENVVKINETAMPSISHMLYSLKIIF